MLVWYLNFAMVIRFDLLERMEFSLVDAGSISVGNMALGVGEWAFLLTSLAIVA